MAIPNAFITELRDRTDIVSLIGGYVGLKRSGRFHKGLCPFHSERTPSFCVYPDTASFYCFGCHKGGDAITFVREMEHLDYVEAVKLLAAKAGMNMPEENVVDGLSETRRRLKEINREAARFFYKQLYTPAGRSALEYFRQRGLTDETITHFGLGWSPDGWDLLSRYLLDKGYRSEDMVMANVSFVNRRGGLNDVFRNRVMFPIIDLQGSVIAFGGRTMEKEHQGRKYVNTGDTPIYKKSNNLYALNWAKNAKAAAGEQRTIIVTEGFMDVIAMHQAGITNVVASQGTAFTQEQARLISRYAQRVILSQDGDAAGQNAIQHSIPVIKATGAEVRVLELPEGLDPDEYIKKYGADRMKLLITNGGQSDVEYRLSRVRAANNVDDADGRVRYLKDVCKVLEQLSPIEQEIFAGRIAEDLHIEKSAIMSQLASGQRKKRYAESRQELKDMASSITGSTDKSNPERREHIRACRAEEALLAALIKDPGYIESTTRRLVPERFVTSFNRKIYTLLCEQFGSGEQPSLTLMSSQLTPDEMSAASRIFNSTPPVGVTAEDINGFIDAILEEGERISGEQLDNASTEDIKKYLETLKRKKK